MIEILGAVSMILAVTGVILNNNRLRGCFYLWIISNLISGYLHFEGGMMALCLRDFIFTLLAIHGAWLWRQKLEVREQKTEKP